ncbi:BMC domain-containing protein [Enterococcus sp. DIV1298c]|uniref:BMC domain-containing protein n=1 Tax=Candidatus Enterococcus mangumiae TaxID=2230878 RepID=A0ABZ2T153_9ENTE|nr:MULTISPECIES: BMC domain-containing protein [unclassified Enterococcus]MBO0462013.1 BMC domain-containing protein [Enterococcus sp. DIV1298c]MBO0491073.1 BMC domain-containing protein [Enterococcus sp. DIV1094]
MNQAIGLIESTGLASAINLSDIMVKSANIELLSIEKTKGFGWMTVMVQGDVGAVKAAIDAAKSAAISMDAYVSSLVIPRPGDNILHVFSSKEEKAEPKQEEAPVAKVEETATKQESSAEKAVEPKSEEVPVIKEDKTTLPTSPVDTVSDKAKTPKDPPKKGNKTGAKKNKKN